jgi:hypothetical protein
MGFRFPKQVPIRQGLTLGSDKFSASFTAGRPWACFKMRGDKFTSTVGVLGTGLSYRQVSLLPR